MKLTVEDFPLRAIGTLIYGRTRSSPVLTASCPDIARQITTTLNAQARQERPDDIGKPWLTVQ